MKKLYKISSHFLMLGVIHTALTPVFYNEFSEDALWFAGTGLALIFLSLLNIAAERVFERWILDICIAANLVGTIYSILTVIALPEIQAVISSLIFLTVMASSLYLRLTTPFESKTDHPKARLQ